jgi:hypothetical protein
VGYPEIFGSGPCLTLSKNEVAEMNKLTVDLDNAIDAAASSIPGVQYVPTTDAFAGHDLCSADPLVTSDKGPLSDWPNWFHPNSDGQMEIANIVAARTANLFIS